MVKLQQKEYDQVLDQCERVLEQDENNPKACYRMSQAAFALAEGSNEAYLQVALKYAEQASKSQPNNAQVKGHYNTVKAMHDTIVESNQATNEEAPKSEQSGVKRSKTMNEKMRSRVKIGGDDDSEEDNEEFYRKQEE